MALKAIIFGTKEATEKFNPFYEASAKRGDFEIVAQAVFDPKTNRYVYSAGKPGGGNLTVDIAIISPKQDLYAQMKILEAQGIPRNRIIDGRVFRTQNLDFPRLLKEGVAHGFLDKFIFAALPSIYPQAYKTKAENLTLSLGSKSYIRRGTLAGTGEVSLGKFSLFATDIFFSLGQNRSHNYHNVGIFASSSMDWKIPRDFYPPQGTCKISVGNDVWCGRKSTFKCSNSEKPLVIGDGAVIASDSVVVKSVPPYAIVGGNPAKIIKYRFEPHVIESLLRIKWWDWSLDKIHDNFKYFNDVEKFISLHDK